jgi:hypothetical protein
MGVLNGFPLKKPPDSYKGTNDQWRALSTSQRRRIRKGNAIREKERAYRNRPDIKADIKEYRKRPEVKAAAHATLLKSKAKKLAILTAQTTTHQDAMESIRIETFDTVSDTSVTAKVYV